MATRHTGITIILVLALFALVGCAPPPQSMSGGSEAAPQASASASPAEESAPPTPLKVSVAPYLSYAPFYIAAEKGYYAEQGLDVELVRLARSSDAVATLAQGQLDVASFPVSSALLNALVRDSGIRVVASKDLAGSEGCVFNGYVARKVSGLLDPDDITADMLRRLTYYAIPTSMSAFVLDLALQQYGLSIDEVTVVELPNTAAVLDALQQGTIDTGSMTEPWITRARAAGAGDVWFRRGAISPNNQLAVVAYGPSILVDNPSAGERFMVAYLQGVRDFAEGKTEATLALLEKEFELDRELLDEVCLPYIPLDGEIDTASILAFGEWSAARDFTDAPVTLDILWEPRFVEYARQELENP